MNLLLNSFLVTVVAEGGEVLDGMYGNMWIRGNGPVVEEHQLEIFGTDGNSVAEEGRAGFRCILFVLQDVNVLSHLM